MFEILLYIVFFFSALLLIAIVLLQEGKGGGLSDAFGGAGAETFGPRAGGINRFTFSLFGVWILSALALHWTAGDADEGSVMQGLLEQPAMTTPEPVVTTTEPAVPPEGEQQQQPPGGEPGASGEAPGEGQGE